MRRREVLIAGLSLPFASWAGAALAWPQQAATGGGGQAFDADTVPALAAALAADAFRPPSGRLPASLAKIRYDQYRDIRFDPTQALWRGQGLPFQAQFFHRGFLFRQRVDIHQVRDGVAEPVTYRPGMFTFGSAPAPRESDLGFAGFRLHAPINRPDYFDEVCAFLGASYFRAVAKGQLYGLSARGLALRTGDTRGEEFPFFKAFWIERPARDDIQIVVHALMDSPSVAGAFRFAITPGEETVFDVSARLYPRVELAQAGIAPLTSMFQFDDNDRAGVDDYREAVHDSDGLALLNGRGEQVWRPLSNPAVLQESAFEDTDPRGFGLMQRQREFGDYGDAEARYERRPSLWVEPLGDWGEGHVHLFEIPTADEYHDNIVAFWRPRQPLAAGREHRFDYRLHWCDRHAWNRQLATVAATRIGALAEAEAAGARRVAIDFAGGRLPTLAADADLRAEVSAQQGAVANTVCHRNPDGNWRIAFELRPQGEPRVELRARLTDAAGAALSETWLYRWTP